MYITCEERFNKLIDLDSIVIIVVKVLARNILASLIANFA